MIQLYRIETRDTAKETFIAPLLPVPARVEARELLDDPQQVLTDLAGNLQDIRHLNRWLRGSSIALRQIRDTLPRSKQASLLDVATGSADIPLRVRRDAERMGMPLDIVALDVSSEILSEASRIVANRGVTLVQGDARALPWPDDSFDLVTCFLALHHFGPTDAERVLAEMWRVASRAIIVVDLVRSVPSYAGTWLATRIVARNRLTRHDGPLSVLRAYTCAELESLALKAGLDNLEVSRQFPSRQVLVARKTIDGLQRL